MAKRTDLEAAKRRLEEITRVALANFPFERIETTGDNAIGEWRRSKRDGFVPIIVGSDADFERIVELFTPEFGGMPQRSAADILDAATRLTHPESLVAERQASERRLQEFLKSRGIALAEGAAPTTGHHFAHTGQNITPEMQAEAARVLDLLKGFVAPELPRYEAPKDPEISGLTVIVDFRIGAPLVKANLIVVPTDDWTTVPAHLKWGGWNGCPAPEFHVAALRSWRGRFGAELIGLGPDVMNLKIARRPETPEAALSLAREQYLYCPDIVDQGTGKVEDLASTLLQEDWWYFWWD
jgi:hypothetical protein